MFRAGGSGNLGAIMITRFEDGKVVHMEAGSRGWIFFGWNIEDSGNTVGMMLYRTGFPQKLVYLRGIKEHRRSESPVGHGLHRCGLPPGCSSGAVLRVVPLFLPLGFPSWFQVEIGPRSKKAGDAILQPLEDPAMLALNLP